MLRTESYSLITQASNASTARITGEASMAAVNVSATHKISRESTPETIARSVTTEEEAA